jgi:pimeloyl-ACP methyl ester carboxylesterase
MLHKLLRIGASAFLYGLLISTSVSAKVGVPSLITPSFDGVPVSYSVCGKGDVTLVFVHGWSCDSRYWYRQVPRFSSMYRVVTVDLAGHGHSGPGRKDYTVASFGEDVKAVVEKVDAKKVILIGHSMGGEVVAAAAAFMPGRVIGVVGVDTLHNVEARYTQEELEKEIRPFEEEFPKKAREFVRAMFVKGSDAELIEWVAADMSCAIPRVAISALRDYFGLFVTGDAAKLFEKVKAPVRAVNADLWPTDSAANRRHMTSFDVVIMKGVGHFPMLERPEEFNDRLWKVVGELSGGR